MPLPKNIEITDDFPIFFIEDFTKNHCFRVSQSFIVEAVFVCQILNNDGAFGENKIALYQYWYSPVRSRVMSMSFLINIFELLVIGKDR